MEPSQAETIILIYPAAPALIMGFLMALACGHDKEPFSTTVSVVFMASIFIYLLGVLLGLAYVYVPPLFWVLVGLGTATLVGYPAGRIIKR